MWVENKCSRVLRRMKIFMRGRGESRLWLRCLKRRDLVLTVCHCIQKAIAAASDQQDCETIALNLKALHFLLQNVLKIGTSCAQAGHTSLQWVFIKKILPSFPGKHFLMASLIAPFNFSIFMFEIFLPCNFNTCLLLLGCVEVRDVHADLVC